jgi:DNA-binding transcriptional LysR family regulator
MQNTDWDDLRYFLAVSERGSVSAAAQLLNVNHSTVLRRLTTLEKRLGVRLFDRLPNGYVVTQAGEELSNELRGVNQQIEAAQRRLGGRDLGLSGMIRITSTDTLAQGLLMPFLSEFRAAHPQIQLQMIINNTFLSLTRREADIAIRPSNTVPENLIGKRVGRIRSAIYGSKLYLRKHTKKNKLHEYSWVAFDAALSHLSQARWVKKHVSEERIAIKLDSLVGMVGAVRHGLGIGLLLCLLADNEEDILRLGEPIEELDTDLWILMHPAVRRVARIKAFTDFLHDRLRTSRNVIRVS